jgi:hypothetical protein
MILREMQKVSDGISWVSYDFDMGLFANDP